MRTSGCSGAGEMQVCPSEQLSVHLGLSEGNKTSSICRQPCEVESEEAKQAATFVLCGMQQNVSRPTVCQSDQEGELEWAYC